MRFFDSVKKRIRNRNIVRSVAFLTLMAATVFVAITNGFSSEAEWKFGFRFSDMGIPLPNWMVSCLFLLMAFLFLCIVISSVKEIFANESYRKVIKAAQEIGEVSFVGQTLENLPKSNFANAGELRYNSLLLFYMKGKDVFLIPTKGINFIQPTKKTGKNTEFYVEIHCQNENIKIQTKEANLLPLANDILHCVKSAQ